MPVRTPVVASELPPLALPLAALEWLHEEGHLKPTKASPFGFLGEVKPKSSAAQRTAAAAELEAHGLSFGSGKSSKNGPLFVRGLTILAAPEARITVTHVDAAPATKRVVHLFVAGAEASIGYFDEQAFYVGPATSTVEIASRLFKQLHGRAPESPLETVQVWPTQLRLVTALWAGAGNDAGASVPVKQALGLLEKAGLSAGDAKLAIGALAEAEIVAAAKDVLTLTPGWAPWLRLVWSGHVLELERQLLPRKGLPETGDVERLLFLGPPGERVECDHVSGKDLEEIMGGKGKAPEASLTVLSYPAAEDLQQSVAALLGVATA